MSHRHQPDGPPPDLSAMEAIACGTRVEVRRWASALTRASIPHTVAEPCEVDTDRPDYAELWVGLDDADRARAALGIGW